MDGGWALAALQPQLQALLPGFRAESLHEVTSTNSLLLERARLRPDPVLLVAALQTAGRGRMGRNWQAQPGASLTFSIGLLLAPRQWQGLSLAVGLALAEALDPAPAAGSLPALGLKWPNDLWRWDGPGRGRKLGGVLIETTSAGAGLQAPRYCVIGVGLNIAPLASAPGSSPQERHASAPPEHPRACLQELQPQATPAETLAQIGPALLRALLAFEAEGFAPRAAGYARRDLLQGQAVHTSGPPAVAGIAAGVDEEGALCVRDGAAMHRIVGGEVSVRFAGIPLPDGSRLSAPERPEDPSGASAPESACGPAPALAPPLQPPSASTPQAGLPC